VKSNSFFIFLSRSISHQKNKESGKTVRVAFGDDKNGFERKEQIQLGVPLARPHIGSFRAS